MKSEELRERTKKFALQIIKLVEKFPQAIVSEVIGKQIIRSATSVAANYWAACRGQSKADFISKICIALEECDETKLWLELIRDAGFINSTAVVSLLREADELSAILTSSVKTARLNAAKK